MGLTKSVSIVPETATEDYDSLGYNWTIKSTTGHELQIWTEGDLTLIRQENSGAIADLLCLTVGQTYDLIKVLTRVLEVA